MLVSSNPFIALNSVKSRLIHYIRLQIDGTQAILWLRKHQIKLPVSDKEADTNHKD